MTVTYNEIIRREEEKRANGARCEQYKIDLYKRYTGKNPAAVLYNGFSVMRPDGLKNYYTIHYRTDNLRPYAIYINGSQTRENTYIYRGACVRALNQIRDAIAHNRPRDIINDINGPEIIT